MNEEQMTQTTGEQVEAAASQQHETAHETNREQQVPLSALEAERAQRQNMQDELKMMKEHLNLLQARQQPQPQPQQPQYDPDDVMTFGEFQKLAGEFKNSLQGELTEMKMMQQYPDYREVVTKYLPEILKKDPALREDLQQNPNFYRAYYLAKNSDSYRKEHAQTQQSADAQRMIENSQKAGSLSQMGGASPINVAKRYRDMSDADFRKEMAKNMGYA